MGASPYGNAQEILLIGADLVSMRAMRCNILRHYLGGSFIGLSRRIAESPVLQRFIGVIAMDEVKVPCKSLLRKYSKFLPAEKNLNYFPFL